MKIAYTLAACAVLLASSALAQPFGPGRGQGAGATAATAPDPATIVARRVAALTVRLTLTTAQQAQATTIFQGAMNSEIPLQASLTTARQAMQDAVKANATATITQVAATIGTLTGQLAEIQHRAQAAFYQILSADQQAKFAQNLGAGRGTGMGMGMGAGMGRGMGMGRGTGPGGSFQ